MTAVILVAVTTTAACDSGDSTPNPTAIQTHVSEAGSAKLHATLTQSRIHEGTRLVNAQITNRDDAPVTVRSVALRTAQNSPVAPTPKETIFEPGQIIDLATRYGPTRCQALDATARPVVHLGFSDGSSVDVPLDKAGVAALAFFNERECRLGLIDSIASIRLGRSFTRAKVGGELVLRGELILRRPPDAASTGTVDKPLRVAGLDGSVLVRLLPDRASVPVSLPPGEPRLRVPVLIGAYRCDEHARLASTQTFVLSVFVRTPGVPEQRVITIPVPPLQVETLDLIDDVCG